MAKIFVSNWITLDGYFADKDGSTDWMSFDEEMGAFNLENLRDADTILFGRKTFEIMENYWPTDAAKQAYPEAYEYMNACKKHTFSKTMRSSGWQSSFHTAINRETIELIKSQTTKDIVVLGSGEISRQLHDLGLIDEYRLLLDPQFLGAGKLFFQDMKKEKLALQQHKAFGCGVVFLKYKVNH